MAILLYSLCVFLAWFLAKKIIEKYFDNDFLWFTFSKESFARLRVGKLNYFQVLSLVIIITVLSPFYYEYPNWGLSHVVSQKKDGIIVKHPLGKFCWSQENCFNIPNGKLITYSSVSPVTLNPKIRPLKYSVNITISDEKKFVTEFPEVKEGRFDRYLNEGNLPGASVVTVVDAVKYQLLEFNEANSKEISRFFNYLDKDQQADFKKFVEDWINPRLAKSGLSIKCNNFMVVEL